jgi:gas vesicle protein
LQRNVNDAVTSIQKNINDFVGEELKDMKNQIAEIRSMKTEDDPKSGVILADRVARKQALVEELRADIRKEIQSAVTELKSEMHRELEVAMKDIRSSQSQLPATAAPSAVPSASDSVIKLNVGGTQFVTSRSTITAVRGSMLDSMLSGRYKVTYDSEGNVFIDRPGKYFGLVLDYLRGMNVRFPSDFEELD